MCGIIGYVGPEGTDVTSILLEGLSKLEYRGYDSAGIAVLTSDGTLELRRRAGKIANLIAIVENGSRPEPGPLGIGHTRWATHGRPNDVNAHPHPDCTGVLTIVHNGIIENYAELRSQLEREGHTFRSETDTEVLSHLRLSLVLVRVSSSWRLISPPFSNTPAMFSSWMRAKLYRCVPLASRSPKSMAHQYSASP